MSALDREKARKVLTTGIAADDDWDDLLDALAGCVTDEPPTIDRYTLIDMLATALGQHRLDSSVAVGALADRVLALLRPAPAQTIDRDALARAMSDALGAHVASDWMMKLPYALADAALALLRPDPRIAKLEALLDDPMKRHTSSLIAIDEVRATLRGQW